MGVVRYLQPDKVEQMFRAVSQHIVEDGLLIVASHSETMDHTQRPASIFQRRGTRFVLIREIVNGYPYKNLLLDLDLTANGGSPEPATDQQLVPS